MNDYIPIFSVGFWNSDTMLKKGKTQRKEIEGDSLEVIFTNFSVAIF